jgi:cell division protein ZapA
MAKPEPESITLEISILGRSYKVACAPDQQMLLQEAAIELDQRMRDARNQGEGVGPERAAVMAGLNAVYDMLEQKAASTWDVSDIKRKIKSLEDRLDRCFYEQEDLF